MIRSSPAVHLYTGDRAWEVFWKWTWFEKPRWKSWFRKMKEGTRTGLSILLPRLGVKSVLDCSCGLGWKTILLAEMGYRIEGSDACGFAVRCATQLAPEEGLRIKFFQSRWEDLGKKRRGAYDCVYNDAFAWVLTRRELLASARGISGALREGGSFVFVGANQWSGNVNKQRLADRTLKRMGHFQLLEPFERDGIRMTVLKVRERAKEAVVDNHVFLIEQRGHVRADVARIMDVCYWNWQDYIDVLGKAGFRRIYSVEVKGHLGKPYTFNVAVKCLSGSPPGA